MIKTIVDDAQFFAKHDHLPDYKISPKVGNIMKTKATDKIVNIFKDMYKIFVLKTEKEQKG